MTTRLEVDVHMPEVEEQSHATLTVSSDRGQHVTFDVRYRRPDLGRGSTSPARYVVGLHGSDGQGFSAHLTFATAFQRALSRATRYQRALERAERRRLAA